MSSSSYIDYLLPVTSHQYSRFSLKSDVISHFLHNLLAFNWKRLNAVMADLIRHLQNSYV